MAQSTKEKMSMRHLLVVLTGIMITFGCSALCFSTWGLFQPVVAEGLGVEKTAFAMYVTVMYLTMTVASPFAGKLLQSMDARVILSGSAILVVAAFLLMSIAHTIVLFYVAAVMLGLGEITLLWLAVPTLINRWFADRAGFFIGLCMAFTGIGGAIWSAVFTALRADGMDFHTIYLIWAVIAAVTSLPFTLLCVRSEPRGLRPAALWRRCRCCRRRRCPEGFRPVRFPCYEDPDVLRRVRVRRHHQHRHPDRHAVPELHQDPDERSVRRGRRRRSHDHGHDGRPGSVQGHPRRCCRQEREGRFGLRLLRWRCRYPAVLVRRRHRAHALRWRLHLRRLLRHGRGSGPRCRSPSPSVPASTR